jgi:hypothetical protein
LHEKTPSLARQEKGTASKRPATSSIFVGVGMFVMKLDMGFRGFAGVMLRVFVMSMGEMRVMSARFVVAVRDVSGGFAMMLCGMFVMFGGVLMMLCGVLGVRHCRLSLLPHLAGSAQ